VFVKGSSDYKKLRKRWFFKEPLTEWFFVEPKIVLLWHHCEEPFKHLFLRVYAQSSFHRLISLYVLVFGKYMKLIFSFILHYRCIQSLEKLNKIVVQQLHYRSKCHSLSRELQGDCYNSREMSLLQVSLLL